MNKTDQKSIERAILSHFKINDTKIIIDALINERWEFEDLTTSDILKALDTGILTLKIKESNLNIFNEIHIIGGESDD